MVDRRASGSQPEIVEAEVDEPWVPGDVSPSETNDFARRVVVGVSGAVVVSKIVVRNMTTFPAHLARVVAADAGVVVVRDDVVHDHRAVRGRAILPADHDSAAPITDDGIPGDDYSVGSRVHLDSPSVALVEHEVVGEQMILTLDVEAVVWCGCPALPFAWIELPTMCRLRVVRSL